MKKLIIFLFWLGSFLIMFGFLHLSLLATGQIPKYMLGISLVALGVGLICFLISMILYLRG